MNDNKTKSFPNGYDVTIVRKDDVIVTIDQNITDREIMNELIDQLELNLSEFIKEERWAGVPFLGNIRIPKVKAMAKRNKEVKHIAFETLPRDKYIMFIGQLAKSDDKIVRHNTFYRHVLAMAMTNNIKLFRSLAKEKGNIYAKLYLYFKSMIVSIDNEMLMMNLYGNNKG